MGRRKKGTYRNVQAETNGWDVLKALVDGLFNFISLSNAAAIAVIWFIVRDVIYVIHLPKDFNYADHLLKNDFLVYLVEDDNKIVLAMGALIIFLIVACIALILYCVFLRKEVERMAEARSKAIHGKETIKKHSSSDLD